MVPFGGWEMPVQYRGIIAEYELTRHQAAMFDICHMGEFIIEGESAFSGLDKLVTQRLMDMPVKSCRYGMALNEQGGVIDDLIVFRLAQTRWMVVVNAATIEKDAAHFKPHLESGSFSDISNETGKIDVQGPASRDILKSFIEGVENLNYYTFDFFDVLGENVIVSRTGYTGELGYEIYYPVSKIGLLWDKLLKMGIEPAGLGARDVLRIEMAYPLYGHEISDEINPLDAGLNRFIDWEKDFIGKTSLLQYKEKGIGRKIFCFAAESRRSPRAGQKIFLKDGQEAGIVTSGTFSPFLKQGVGLGFMPVNMTVGERIFFGDEDVKTPALIVIRPIYKDGTLKN